MPTFPISSASGLGLGGVGGGTQAPALVQGVGLTVNQNGAPSSAVWLFPWSASDPAALTGQIPSGLVFGTGDYAGQVYVVNDSGAPVKFLDNGALSGTITVDSLDLGDNDPANFGDADDLVIVHTGTLSSITNSTGDLVIDNTDVNDQIILRVGTDTTATGIEFRNNSDAAIWKVEPTSATAGRLVGADGSALIVGTGLDLSISHDGTDNLIVGSNGDIVIDNTDANDAIILRVGADSSATTIDLRNNSDVSLFSMIPSGAAAGDFKGLDNADLVVGTGNDFRVNHNGTLTTITSTTGNLLIDNTAATGSTLLDMGADTSATSVAIRNNSGTTRFSVDGAGTVTIPDGSTLFTAGAGSGAGDLVQVYGPDITHGWARYVYQNDLSPAAIETAIMTVPAMSRVLVAQANVQSALTGGGTTVTFGIGITGDVDAYGTASNSGVQADLLTQNAKINAMAGIAANAGASLGVFSAGTVAMKLIGAATGGASAGDTALTVGSVRVRVIYETLLPLADA